MNDDPYTDPLSGVLRNRLGITDRDRLQQVEAALSRAALAELALHDLPGSYDMPHLQAFHRELFDDLYPWAGSVRTVWIAKTDAFCPPQHIESYAAAVFGSLAKEHHLRGLDRAAFVERVTHYFAEVNAIHPFREGNGRTQRAFFRQLSSRAGWAIDWTALDPEENVTASAASLRGDNGPLRMLLDGLVQGSAAGDV